MKNLLLGFFSKIVRVIGAERATMLIIEIAKNAQINLFDVAKDNISYLKYDQKIITRSIPEIAHVAELDLLTLAYNNIGILKYQNILVSGECFLISRVLKTNFGNILEPIMLDVGANVGEYSKILRMEFPNAKIYAFEPNLDTFNKLISNVDEDIKCVNVGMGAENKSATMFTYSDSASSPHASIYSEVFRSYHNKGDIVEVEFQLTTLDLFCEQEGISSIDFLKIDTEGNELEVLLGAKQMLSGCRINIVQFEFGECDVFSRVFLRDLYNILSDYNIYRLDSERLIPLFDYNYVNEIFRFQNFIAVNKSFLFNDIALK